jgi:hypothetical protein
MFDARQRTREDNWRDVDRGRRGLPARLRPPSLLGVLGCVALLAWPLAAEETATAEPEAGLKARGQAFWEARIKEDYAGQYALLGPQVRRQMSLTNYMQAQGPLLYLEARIEGVTMDETKAVLTVHTWIRIKHPLLERRTQELVVLEGWVKR